MRARDSVVYTPVSLGPDTDDEETLVNAEVYNNGKSINAPKLFYRGMFRIPQLSSKKFPYVGCPATFVPTNGKRYSPAYRRRVLYLDEARLLASVKSLVQRIASTPTKESSYLGLMFNVA